ncbi:MAG: ORF6N domain-containing protein [Selenomonadaceae bacterium]|nr:ORF6N domain-containing protein [Selenomonadaceae bacterium]
MTRKKKFKLPALIEYSNEPVLTTEVLAKYYETSVKIISQNFIRNIDRFEEGKHFFKLEGETLQAFKTVPQNEEWFKHFSVLYLWTRRGAARHAKMLNTEKAWEVFEKLEEFYFDHEKFEWNKARTDGKIVRKKFTDVIKEFYEYAKVQGTTRPQVAFQMKYTRICNKLAGLPAVGGRDKATVQQIGICSWSENRMAEIIGDCMEKALPYKEIENQIELWASAVDNIFNKAYFLPSA